MEAAFFDLDKTVIARSSMMAFARPFHRAGLVSRKALAKGACTQYFYLRRGAGPQKLARIQRSVLEVTAGWERTQVSAIVAEHLTDAVDPITYTDAVRLISVHRAAGRRVFLVSAAPEDIVEPIGRHLGVDETIASRARLDETGRYAGELERYAYGPAKAALVAEAARRHGIDLGASWAYSDSMTDAPMLEIVGHPVAVNPDRALRGLARRNGWEVLRFARVGPESIGAASPAGSPDAELDQDGLSPPGCSSVGPAGPETPGVVPAGQPDQVALSATDQPVPAWRRHATALASATAVLTTGGGLTAWLWYRRIQLHPG